MNPLSILTMYRRSSRVLLLNLDGLTPQQAFWTPAPNINCINWVLGHIVSSRTTGLSAVGKMPVWDDHTRARYRAGSAPITGEGDGVLDLMRLLFDFAESQRRMESGFESMTADALEAASPFEQFSTVADHLLYLQTHEMSHVGQVIILRELQGFESYWD